MVSSSDRFDEDNQLNEHVDQPGDPDGVFAADEQKRWQESHPIPSATQYPVYKRSRSGRKVVITLVLIAVAAFGAYWFGAHEATKSQSGAKRPMVAQSRNQSAQNSTVQTKHYDSTNFTLGFDYPSSWTVNDTTTKLTITSPDLQLPTATGVRTGVHVVVSIQNPQSTIPGFPINGAEAILTSDHLTYTQPSAVQRAQTYLSYLSYGAGGGLDALYITGDNGYQQGQQVPMSDVVKGNPLISVTFQSCSDNSCASGKAVTLSSSGWQAATTSKDIVKLLESIVLVG